LLFSRVAFISKDDVFNLGYACMTTVKVRPGDSIDKALRALKKRLDKEGVMKSVKAHRFYSKPSVKKRIKSKAASKYKRQRAG
jgi:small subunit ribosomal protein S21